MFATKDKHVKKIPRSPAALFRSIALLQRVSMRYEEECEKVVFQTA